MPRLVLAALLLLVAALVGVDAAAAAELGFAPAQYIDQQLAGGEPLVYTDPAHHTIVYSTHEGTTHLYRPGLASAVTFAPTYRNQVNIWTSKDGGRTFTRNDFGGGFTTDPTKNTGFSDPDLTQDEGGRIYNTGINLVNDALFSSKDGGLTWDRGTVQCHDGDRPWLAGGKADEVFLATNTSEGVLSHQIFTSTDGGNTCSTSGIPDAGTLPDGTTYTGNGKLYYDRASQRLVEPVNFQDANGKTIGLGVGTWKRGDKAFAPHLAVKTSVYAHWAAIALDDAGGLYLTWDNDPRATGTATGCDGAETPLANQVSLVHSPDFGGTWTAPQTVAAPPGKRVFWPWIAAGDKGKVSVVWYQTDKVVDLACESADISVFAANVQAADTSSPTVATVDAVGRPISHNNICQSGTTCVATGEDRRLGDFFTNALDEQGCVIIGTGDTMQKDPISGDRLTALPLFVRQDSGPSLRGGGDCSGQVAALGLPAGDTPGAKGACASRRSFRIRLRHPAGDRLRSASVFVNGKRVRVLTGRRLRSSVDLRGLPKGRVTVRIQAVTQRGKKLTEVRRYRTCVRKGAKG
jgi:hypothetical protein